MFVDLPERKTQCIVVYYGNTYNKFGVLAVFLRFEPCTIELLNEAYKYNESNLTKNRTYSVLKRIFADSNNIKP